MSKVNAHNILARACDQFYKATGEVIALTFTWNGSLTVYGPDAFKQLVTDNKHKSKPLIDEHMRELLDGDIKKYSRSTLRKLVSWAVQISIGGVHSKSYLI